MRPKGLLLPAFFLFSLALGAQTGGDPKIISPYVTDLMVDVQEGQVVLTWSDSQDLEKPVYLIYRLDREITKTTLPQATLVGTVSQGEEKASDRPDVSGSFFYAILAKDSNGKIWQQFLPYQNKTLAALDFTPVPPTAPPVAEKPAETSPVAPAPAVPAPAAVEPSPVQAQPAVPSALAVPVAPVVPQVSTPAPVPSQPAPTPAPKGLAVLDFQEATSSSASSIQVDPARPLALPGRRLGNQETSAASPVDQETAKVLSALLKSQGRGRETLPSLKIFPEEASLTLMTGGQKDLSNLVRSYFLQGKWAEGAPLFTSFASKEPDRNRQARAYFYAAQSYLKAGDSRNALVNFLQARRILPEAQVWADILLVPNLQTVSLKELIPLEVEGATPEMLRPLAAETKSTVKILEETALLGAGSYKKPPVAEALQKEWISQAEALTEDSQVKVFEQVLEKAQTEGVLDQLVAVLETETSRRETPPGLHFALSLAYGRQGLMQKAYQAVVAAVQKASAPGIIFNLAMAYGRRDLLAPASTSGVAALEVKSTPPGATIRLNGQEIGQSPVNLDGLRPGNHQIEVYRLLYTPKTLTVSLASGDKKNLDVGLGPLKSELTPKEEFTGRGVPEVRVQLGHSDDISTLVFTPDSQKLITGSTDGGIRIWSTQGKIEIQNLPGHFGKITELKVSPDGKTLGSTSWDGTVRLWDLETGNQTALLEGHTNMVNSLDFSPDGQTLVTGSWDTTLRTWSVATGKPIATSKALDTGISDVVWTSPGLAAAVDQNGVLLIWDTLSLEVVKTQVGATTGADSRLFWDQGTNRIVLFPTSGAPLLFDPVELKSLGVLEGSYGSFTSEPSAGTQGKLLTLRKDVEGRPKVDIRLLNQPKVLLREFTTDAAYDRALLSPDGQTLAAATGRNLQWLSPDKGQVLNQNLPVPGIADLSVISPVGNLTAVRTQSNEVTLVNAATGIPTGTAPIKSLVTALAFSNDGSVLVIGTDLGNIYFLNTADNTLAGTLDLGVSEIKQLLSPVQGNQVMALQANGTFHRLDAKNFSSIRSFATTPQARRMAVDRNGLWMAVQSEANVLTLYDLTTESQALGLPKHHSFINDFLFTTDGKKLILGDNKGILSLLSLDTGEKAQEVLNLRSPIECLAISGDGLALGALDSTITLWNLAEGKKIKTMLGHLDAVNSLSFDRNGKLYSSGKDHLSIMWNGKTGNHLFFQVLSPNDGGYLTWIREGFYSGRGGLEERVVSVVDRSLVVPLSELAFAYKREDVVSARIQERDILPLLRGR